MPERARSWIMPLSDIDRIAVRLVTDGHDVLQFSVQYEALIAGHWRKLTRYDNAHGSGPHRHVYYPGKSYRQIMHVTNDNDGFTEAQMVLKKHFRDIRENYIMLLEAMDGGRS